MFQTEIDRLLHYGLSNNLIDPLDTIYVRNRLMDFFHETAYEASVFEEKSEHIQDILDDITRLAVKEGYVEERQTAIIAYQTELMNILTPLPSKVIETFKSNYTKSPIDATDAYYAFSKHTNYIRTRDIAKDKKWQVNTLYGMIDITINLSKPEKDPKEIALAKLQPKSSYPKCLLCKENEGYAGTLTHPARHNHRIIPLQLADTDYYLQYSPYSYYNEHCIVFNANHVPMAIDDHAFRVLLDFVDRFPHYLLGSNADLPIVGGSILTHDHMQGGRYEFAMERANVLDNFTSGKYPGVSFGRLHWMVSSIRATSKNKEELLAFADHVLETWRNYDDPDVDIFSHTGDTLHNTITPIARKKNDTYVLDLALRNNRTSQDYPDGIFHPHPSLHHIKKENIGLIEVMGLAVLPARLLNEMAGLKDAWLNNTPLRDELLKHETWFHEIKAKHTEVTCDNIDAILHEEIGQVFLQVLNDAGVFKNTEEGQAAFIKFLNTL